MKNRKEKSELNVYSLLKMKRHELSLEQKVLLIKDNSDGHGLSIRKLADKYSISKSSVANILTRRDEYQQDYLNNANKGVKRKLKNDTSKHIDEVLFEWFTAQRAKHIPISGPLLQEKARQIADELGLQPDEFKASNGWLEKFRNRHLIGYRQISGESAGVCATTTEEWKQRLGTIIDEYSDDDIYNADETGLLFKAMPDRSLVLSKEECKGGKRSKERYTVLLCSNWSGSDKLKPLVIGKHSHLLLTNILNRILGKSRQPRCFKGLNISNLPVTWKANRTAWMNAKLFSEWLTEINKVMKKNSRQILLFLDNAPCHPHDLELSNIKFVFFPPNTTSIVQPLDQGVINSFKCHYRRMLVKHIIAQCTMAHSIDQINVTALDAIRWIDEAWKTVTSTTIRNGFSSAGFCSIPSNQHTSDHDIVLTNEDEHQSSIKNLDDLLSHLGMDGNRMSAIELINIDSNIPVFNEWNDNNDLHYEIVNIDSVDNMDDVEDETQINEAPLKLPEALDMLRRLHLFASTEQPELHALISQLETKMTDLYISSKTSKQSCITDFFQKN
jgi:transcriptional regulator with XRE-family HTH domain